jgi:hypothetical protein
MMNLSLHFKLQLYTGDEYLSYGYEKTGQIWTKNQSEWYGERYSVDDTITCYAVSYISFQLE